VLLEEWEKRDPVKPRWFCNKLANSKHRPLDLMLAAIAQVRQSVRGDGSDEHVHSESAIDWWVEHIHLCAKHTGNRTMNMPFELIMMKWAKMVCFLLFSSVD
jgi:hypothetical protein